MKVEVELDGTEMDRIFATSKTHSKRRVVVSITPLLSQSSSNTMMMKSSWHIAIPIPTQTALNYFSVSASQKAKTESEKPLFARPLLEMIVKWPSLQISVLGQKR